MALVSGVVSSMAGDDDFGCHRRRRLPRLASLRLPARAGPPGHLRRQPRDGLAREHRAPPRSTGSRSSTTTSSTAIRIDEPVDFVFHLARPASPVDYLRLPLQTLKVGSYGTHNALGLAKWKRARFLISSTSEVYGDPQVHPQPETYWGNVNPIGPRGVYDEAKRYAEALTMAYHTQQGVDTCIARIFNTYGPRMGRTTAARPSSSSTRRSRASRSPSSATARRRGRSATSTT